MGKTIYLTTHEYISEKKPELIEKLEDLERVSKALKINDLHIDNIIITSAEDQNIVPIDCESRNIEDAQSTGLIYDEKIFSKGELTTEEMKIISHFEENLIDISIRFVPVSTAAFISGLMDSQGYIFIAKTLLAELKEKKYKILCDLELLHTKILFDFLNNDIPFLINKIFIEKSTKQGREIDSQSLKLYYGSATEENLIAIRKMEYL